MISQRNITILIAGISLFCGLTGSIIWGCGSKKNEKIRIGFLVKQPEEIWFQDEWKFAQKCADRYGFDLIKIGVPDGEKVLAGIDNLASQGAQGFVICTPEVRLGPAIVAKANSRKMKVFAVDDQFVGADGKFMDVPYMGLAAKNIGEMVGKALFEEYNKRGWNLNDTAVAAITFEELNTLKERTNGSASALIQAGFPENKIYRCNEKTTDVPGSFDAANTLLAQHREVKNWLVFSVNDEGVLGAVRALENQGFKADRVIGIGIGGGTAIAEFEKGAMTGFYATCLISPLRHGFETSEYLYKWIKDGIAPPKDTRTVGFIITRENYKQVMREQGLLDESDSTGKSSAVNENQKIPGL
jgi:L-arabinose transport system substrate-binding protein